LFLNLDSYLIIMKKGLSKSLNLQDDQLDGCRSIIQKLEKNKESYQFRYPVNWKREKLFDYPQRIKHPMDLSTVKKKLKSDKYPDIEAFAEDLRLIWSNCKSYNQDGSVSNYFIFRLFTTKRKF